MLFIIAAGIGAPAETGNLDSCAASSRFGVIRNMDDPLCRDPFPECDGSCPKIAVFGYGTVGSGIVEVIDINGDLIAKRAGEAQEAPAEEPAPEGAD